MYMYTHMYSTVHTHTQEHTQNYEGCRITSPLASSCHLCATIPFLGKVNRTVYREERSAVLKLSSGKMKFPHNIPLKLMNRQYTLVLKLPTVILRPRNNLLTLFNFFLILVTILSFSH